MPMFTRNGGGGGPAADDYSDDYDHDGDYWSHRAAGAGAEGGGPWPSARVPLHRQPMHMPYGTGARRSLLTSDDAYMLAGPSGFRPPLPHNPLSGQLTPSPHVANANAAPPPARSNSVGSNAAGLNAELYRDFASSPALPIKIEYSTGAIQCDVTWRAPVELAKSQMEYSYRIDAHGGHTQTMELPSWKTRLTMKTTPGQWYTVEVRAIAKGKCIAHGSVQIKAVFTRDEMQKLFNTAVEFVRGGSNMHPFEVFYRCKPKPYWDDIYHHRNGIMEVYLKDDNGQAASPVNGVLKGLFFSGRLLNNGCLPPNSPFGNVRACIPAQMLYNPIEYTAYFSDFYCNYITHYVTIIVCRRGTQTENFCRQTLIPVPMDNNPFLLCMPARNPITVGGQQRLYEYHINKKVWVEMYYTDNVPLIWGRFDNIDAWGAGTSKVGGLEHNKYCTVCNLYPLKAPGDLHAEQADGDAAQAADGGGQGRKRPLLGPDDYDDEIDKRTCPADLARDYNTTLHLCVQIERDRLAADGDLYTGCGDSDVIETLCSIVDDVVAEVGDTLAVPHHGNVGAPYVPLYARTLRPAAGAVDAFNGAASTAGTDAATATDGDPAQSDVVLGEPADVYFTAAARAKLSSQLARDAFDKLAHTASTLAVRWKELSALLDALNQSIAVLDRKVLPLRSQMAAK